MAFGGIEMGLRDRGIPDPSKIALSIKREYDFNRASELSPDTKFDTAIIKNLQRRGLFVSTFSGLNSLEINKMAERGSRIEVQIPEADSELLTLPAKITQVAFNPSTLFLPDSNNLTFDQQMEYLADFNSIVQKEMPEVKAINGSLPDWTEAIYRYVCATGRGIFSKRHGYRYTTTSTIASNGFVMDIGGAKRYDNGLSIDINKHDLRMQLGNIFLATMIVPVGLKI